MSLQTNFTSTTDLHHPHPYHPKSLNSIISTEILSLLKQDKIALFLTRYSGASYYITTSTNGFSYKQCQKYPQNNYEIQAFSLDRRVKNEQYLLHDIDYCLTSNPSFLQIRWFSEQNQQEYYRNLLHPILLTLPPQSVLVIVKNQSITLLGGFGSDFSSENIPLSLSITDIITFLYQGSSNNLYRIDLNDTQYNALVSLCAEYNFIKHNNQTSYCKSIEEALSLSIFKILRYPTTIFSQFRSDLMFNK